MSREKIEEALKSITFLSFDHDKQDLLDACSVENANTLVELFISKLPSPSAVEALGNELPALLRVSVITLYRVLNEVAQGTVGIHFLLRSLFAVKDTCRISVVVETLEQILLKYVEENIDVLLLLAEKLFGEEVRELSDKGLAAVCIFVATVVLCASFRNCTAGASVVDLDTSSSVVN